MAVAPPSTCPDWTKEIPWWWSQDWAWLLAGLLNTCCILWSKHWIKRGRGFLSSPLTTPLSYICFGRHFSKNLSCDSIPPTSSQPPLHPRTSEVSCNYHLPEKRKTAGKQSCICFTLSLLALALSCLASCGSHFFSQHCIVICLLIFVPLLPEI